MSERWGLCRPCRGSGERDCPICDGVGFHTWQERREGRTRVMKRLCESGCDQGIITCSSCDGDGCAKGAQDFLEIEARRDWVREYPGGWDPQ